MGCGDTIELAREQAYELAAIVILPNIRYRQDIGANLIAKDWQQLIDWGMWIYKASCSHCLTIHSVKFLFLHIVAPL